MSQQIDVLVSWLNALGNGTVNEITPGAFRGALSMMAIGIVNVSDDDLDTVKASLKGYTWKARRRGITALLGQTRVDEFLAFTADFGEEHSDLLQETEGGNVLVGIRRLLFDIICYAFDSMPADRFYAHVRAAAHNGKLFAEGVHDPDQMEKIISPVDGEQHRPASFPPIYPARLADFLLSWKV